MNGRGPEYDAYERATPPEERSEETDYDEQLQAETDAFIHSTVKGNLEFILKESKPTLTNQEIAQCLSESLHQEELEDIVRYLNLHEVNPK